MLKFSFNNQIFRCLWKITHQRVFDLLPKIENSEATLLYLELIRSVLLAYVVEETSVADRIFNAVFAVYFIRIWRQWLFNSETSVDHFLTQNAWEGLELNLILLIKLAIENNAENIYFFNSQNNESFFRLLRSFTGMESMVVNCSLKSFISRVHRIQLEEILMAELSKNEKFTFPKLISREKHQRKPKANLSKEEIEELIRKGMDHATEKAKQIGMVCDKIELERFLKVVNIVIPDEVNNENTDEEDFLGASQDVPNNENLDELHLDEISTELDNQMTQGIFDLQGVTFSNEKSGVLSLVTNF